MIVVQDCKLQHKIEEKCGEYNKGIRMKNTTLVVPTQEQKKV